MQGLYLGAFNPSLVHHVPSHIPRRKYFIRIALFFCMGVINEHCLMSVSPSSSTVLPSMTVITSSMPVQASPLVLSPALALIKEFSPIPSVSLPATLPPVLCVGSPHDPTMEEEDSLSTGMDVRPPSPPYSPGVVRHSRSRGSPPSLALGSPAMVPTSPGLGLTMAR